MGRNGRPPKPKQPEVDEIPVGQVNWKVFWIGLSFVLLILAGVINASKEVPMNKQQADAVEK